MLLAMGAISESLLVPIFYFLKGIPGRCAEANADPNASDYKCTQFDVLKACARWQTLLAEFEADPEQLLDGRAAMRLGGQRMPWTNTETAQRILCLPLVREYVGDVERVREMKIFCAEGDSGWSTYCKTLSKTIK